MKPYSVIKVQDTPLDFVSPRAARIGGQDFAVYANIEHQVQETPNMYTGEHPVYFVEREDQAEALAAHLAAKRPGTHWLVAKSTASFRCAAAPVAKAVFTDRGLLPPN